MEEEEEEEEEEEGLICCYERTRRYVHSSWVTHCRIFITHEGALARDHESLEHVFACSASQVALCAASVLSPS